MKFFQHALLAVAGSGLLAPVAASAGEVPSLSGTAAINDYMQQQAMDRILAIEAQNQVTSVTQFSDVLPTDWAYQALSNLVQTYGCVAGFPDGSFKGGQKMTRYEAAALLNACLDRVTEITDELQRLIDEFKTELATLRGRVDGLEKKVGKLEATQFSTTTKLKGQVNFIIGGVDQWETSKGNFDRTTFTSDVKLSLDTSFNGKDLLRTRLRSGNFSSDPFGSAANVFKLDQAEENNGEENASNVWVDRLFYRFPAGPNVNLTLGALVRNTEMLSFIPSAYKSEILDFFTVAGAAGTYNKSLGAGAGFSWKQKVDKGKPFFTVDVNWVSQITFDDGYTTQGGKEEGFANSQVGAFESQGAQNILAQLGYKGSNWGAALAYRFGTWNSRLRDPNSPSSQFFYTLGSGQVSNSVSLAGYWEPLQARWAPSISAGFSYTHYSEGDDGPKFDGEGDFLSWMIGLSWKDVFVKGNSAGLAVGVPLYALSSDNAKVGDQDPGYMFEVFYKYQVTDNISVTPSIFWITRNYNDLNEGSSTWGGVIQTTFRF